jgi:hypothetical protein
MSKTRTLLWLDDLRDPGDPLWIEKSPLAEPYEYIWVKNYIEFTTWIRDNGLPTAISFDHDLGDEHYAPEEFWDDKYNDWLAAQNPVEKTGHDCAKWLVEFCMDNGLSLPTWAIHSANPVGALNIKMYLEGYQKTLD